MKALLTGGSGFIGSAVMRELAAVEGLELFVLQHHKSVPDIPPGVHLVHGSLAHLDLSTLKPDVVVHLARPTARFRGRWGRKLAAWQGKRWNSRLIRAMKAMPNDPSLVYVSGSLMYGSSADEDGALKPISFAREYHAIEQPLLEAMNENSLPVLMLRVPWVIGKGSWFEWIYRKPSCASGRIPLFGDGENRMQFIAVEDVARALIVLWKGGARGVRNVFSPNQMTQKAFVNTLAEAWNCRIERGEDIHERAISEAFSSDIVLCTGFHELDDFEWTPLSGSLGLLLENE